MAGGMGSIKATAYKQSKDKQTLDRTGLYRKRGQQRQPSSSADYSSSCTGTTGREPQEHGEGRTQVEQALWVGRRMPAYGRGAAERQCAQVLCSAHCSCASIQGCWKERGLSIPRMIEDGRKPGGGDPQREISKVWWKT